MSTESTWDALCKEEKAARAAHVAIDRNKGQLKIDDFVEQETAAREAHRDVLRRMDAERKREHEKIREQTYGAFALKEFLVAEGIRVKLERDDERGEVWSVEELERDGWKKVELKSGGEGWERPDGAS